MPASSRALLLTQVVWPSVLADDHRAIRHDGVDQFPARHRTRAERGHQPAATRDPRLVRVLHRIFLDRRDVLVDTVKSIEVAAVGLDAGADRMDVRILESRYQHAALQVDHARRRPDMRGQVFVESHEHDAAIADRNRLRPAPRAVHRIDRAILEREIGRRGSVVRAIRCFLCTPGAEGGEACDQQATERGPEVTGSHRHSWSSPVSVVGYWKSRGMVLVQVFSRSSLPFSDQAPQVTVIEIIVVAPE